VSDKISIHSVVSNYIAFYFVKCSACGTGSSVGIVTEYGPDDPGPFQAGPGVHPASCKMGTRSFPEVK